MKKTKNALVNIAAGLFITTGICVLSILAWLFLDTNIFFIIIYPALGLSVTLLWISTLLPSQKPPKSYCETHNKKNCPLNQFSKHHIGDIFQWV
ncbi:hypothetical protein ACFLVC_02765 [Chloroflexota bacterium]